MASDKLTNMQEGFSRDIASGRFQYDWQSYENNYSTKNMSKNSIYVETCKLLQNPKISQRIEVLRKETVKRNEVTIDEVLEQLANWLLFDPLDITDMDTDCVKQLKSMDKKARMSLAEIHVQELWGKEPGDDGKMHTVKIGELKKVKFIDKRAVSDQFMKKFGAYVSNDNDSSSSLDAVRELVKELKKS
jgi:phage terminase small subunit